MHEARMMRLARTMIAWIVLAGTAGTAVVRGAEPVRPPAMSSADRVRLAEAYRLAAAIGDGIWPGWSRVPFATVLVAGDWEYFVRHPHPPSGSTPLVGTPETTGSTSPTDWIVTLLHEHFHQLQEAQPGFYDKTAALGLSRGDQTGMWMLSFPFAYDAPRVRSAYETAAAALRDALAATEGDAANRYLRARTAFRAALADDDRKYMDFQLWKEGVARYTQVRVARWAAASYRPTPVFAALPGYVGFDAVARSLSDQIPKELAELSLAEAKRTVFYPYGAAEALLLDRIRPSWRGRYFTDLFTLEPAFEGASSAK
jgi:hypothetical protein